MTISTGDQAAKLLEKRNTFLALVRKYPGISRQECAETMRVSTFYASKLVPELVKEGMVTEAEPGGKTIGRGRPSKPLHIDPEYEYFAGIDLEASTWRFVITDFQGNCIFSLIKTFHQCASREEYLTQLEKLLHDAIKQSGSRWSKVKSIGIGAPGFLNLETGVIEKYEILPEFNRIPLRNIYQKISGKETFICHNIDNLSIYDLQKRPEAEKLSVLHVALRSGISSALSLNGSIYRGSKGLAGEIGLSLSIDNRTLQNTAGLHALQERLPDLPESFWAGDAKIVEKKLLHKETCEVLRQAMELTAIALANVAIFIDPDEIIIYSRLFPSENKLWQMLIEQFAGCRKKQGFNPDIIRLSASSELTPAIGAAIYAIENSYKV
jgi:predicted NBD/HSP70 family sugar kinase